MSNAAEMQDFSSSACPACKAERMLLAADFEVYNFVEWTVDSSLGLRW
jgi:hypothetical protein